MQYKDPIGIAVLLGKYLSGEKLTRPEQATVDTWIAQNEQLWKKLSNPAYIEKKMETYPMADKVQLWEKISSDISKRGSRQHSGRLRSVSGNVTRRTFKYAAAIALIAVVAILLKLYLNTDNVKQGLTLIDNHLADSLKTSGQAVAFRGHSAALMLATGEVIHLSGKSDQLLMEKDGTVLQNNENELVYTGDQHRGPSVLHTLVIPRGSTYQLKLSDGTSIWLNSGTTLRFPTHFDGKTREVYLSGEAYFDVTHNTGHPFIVRTDRMNITVLGTSFNVSSYPDEPGQKTVLFKGSVKVNERRGDKIQKEVLLEPGYEAVIKNNSSDILVKKLKQLQPPEWRNNSFVFDNEELGSIMRRLGREYNVKVGYALGVDTTLHYTGKIKMGETIKEVLDVVELMGKVRFQLKGDKLLVMPVDDSKREE